MAVVILIVIGASQLRAQDEEITLEILEARITALEATIAAANMLAGIPIQEEDRCTPYSSADYKYPQMLEAQIVPETGGRIYSPYTGETFTRADEVDIEHIVARSEAHDSGLCAADSFTRLAFASDMLNLTFASPLVNRDQKGAKDVAEWLPEINQCWFVNRVVAVKRRYGLSMDAREATAARSVLESCSSVSMVIVDREATVTPTPEAPLESGTQTITPTPEGSPEADPLNLYDTNGNGRITCAEARQHGIAPVRSDHPAYPYMRDSDGDGVVCEES